MSNQLNNQSLVIQKCQFNQQQYPQLLFLQPITLINHQQYQQNKNVFQHQQILNLRNDNSLDLIPYTNLTTFKFQVREQIQLTNTKIQLIIFGYLNKDVKDIKLLGLSSVDFRRFQLQSHQYKPFHQQIKLPLDKSQDRNAFLTISIVIQSISNNCYNVSKIQTPSTLLNSTTTSSFNKQELLGGKKKICDHPIVYQISRQNYKKSEFQKDNKQKSTSRQRNIAGSYQKKFQYEHRQHAPKPREPSKQYNKNKEKEKAQSPMPRIKTPQPITHFSQSVEFLQKTTEDIPYEPSQTQYMNHYNNNKMFDKTIKISYIEQDKIIDDYPPSQNLAKGHKITIDVHRSKLKPTTNNNCFYNVEEFEKKNYISNTQKQNISQQEPRTKYHFEKQSPKQNTGRIRHNLLKDQQQPCSTSSQKQKKHNTQNCQISSKTRNEQQPESRLSLKQSNKNKQINNQLQQSYYSATKNSTKSIYKSIPSPSLVNNSIMNNSMVNNSINKSQTNQNNIQISTTNNIKLSPQLPSKQDNITNQIQKSTQPQNKFKQVSDKFQLILKMVSNQRSQSSSSGKNNISIKNEALPKNKITNPKSQDNRINSPHKISCNQCSKDQNKTILQSSANTFKQQYFSSKIQISPQKSDIKHVKSFNYELQSNTDNVKDKQQQQQEEKQSNTQLTGRFMSNIHFEKPNKKPSAQNSSNQQQNKSIHQNQNLENQKINQLQPYESSRSDQLERLSQIVKVTDLSAQKQKNMQQSKIDNIDNIEPSTQKLHENSHKTIDCQSQTQPLQCDNPSSQPNKKQSSNQISNKIYQYKIISNPLLRPSISISKQSQQKIKIKYQQQINNLSHQLVQAQENLRKIKIEKQIDIKKLTKEHQQKLQKINHQYQKLKSQCITAQNINEKLNNERQQNATEQFKSLKKKINQLQQLNSQLTQQLKSKQSQNPCIPLSINSSLSLSQQNQSLKKQLSKYQSKIRNQQNDIQLSKTTNSKLQQENKQLKNQIQTLLQNNKNSTSKQSNIDKTNLQSTNNNKNTQIQNTMLKQQIDNLQLQVKQLNILLQTIITQTSKNDKTSSTLKASSQQSQKALLSKIKALQHINQNNQQQIKADKIKLAKIVNRILQHKYQKLINEVHQILLSQNITT